MCRRLVTDWVARSALLLTLLRSPAPPPFSARWGRPGVAVVSFAVQSRACLYREPLLGPSVPLSCYDQAGDYALTFGGPRTDANFRPQAHDVFVLVTNGETRRARLVSVVYVGVVRR